MADDDKTEKPTPKKRRDARKKGDVLLSKDVVSVATLIATFSVIYASGVGMVTAVEDFLFYCLGLFADTGGNLVVIHGEAIRGAFISAFLKVVTFPIVATILMSFISTGYQTKWLFSLESIKPTFSKMNPLEGIKKLFSMKSVIDALKNLVKISILLYIVYRYFVNTVLEFGRYFYIHPAVSGAEVMQHVIFLVMQIALAFAVIAVIDFGYQWYEYEKKLKMSIQDIKDEYKQTEGDPKVKGKIKQKQMQMAQQRMMQDVKAADVIVRNPTHYAVALRYKLGLDPVPVILAMGEDELAFRIIMMGERFEIPIVENVPVARALYAEGTLGKQIPPSLYGVVAKLLTVVMGINSDNIDEHVTRE